MNSFTDITLSASTLDRYYIRSSIFSSIQKTHQNLKGVFLMWAAEKCPIEITSKRTLRLLSMWA